MVSFYSFGFLICSTFSCLGLEYLHGGWKNRAWTFDARTGSIGLGFGWSMATGDGRTAVRVHRHGGTGNQPSGYGEKGMSGKIGVWTDVSVRKARFRTRLPRVPLR